MLERVKLLTLLLVFIPALFLKPIHGQTPTERHQQIRAAIDAGDLRKALSDLSALRQANSGLFEANNYDYLQARLSSMTGDTEEATTAYQSVATRKSVLAQYALWHLSQSARSIGDLILEREWLRQLIALYPSSLLREGAVLRLGESFFESADYPGAISAVEQLTQSRNIASSREATVLVGQSYLRQGKQVEARTIFTRLVMQMPDASRPDDFALAATQALDGLDSGGSQPLNEADHLLRASIYQFNRDFAGARSHYLAIVQHYPQSTTVPNALYQTGRGLYLEAKYDEGLKYFQRVLDQYPNSTSARDALTSIAATYNRLKRPDDAVAAYRRLIDQSPDAQNPERAYLNIIDILHEAGRYAEARTWVQQTRKQFKGQIGDALAVFADLRINQAQGNWQAVVADADELSKMPDLGGTRIPGGTTKPEVIFLRANALEQLGRSDEAISGYLSLADGRGEYYGGRATQRLTALASDAKTRSLIEARFNTLRADAKRAMEGGQVDQARTSAQAALRLTQNAAETDELLNLVQRAYVSLAPYKLPSFKQAPIGRQEVLTTHSNSGEQEPSHTSIAGELFFLGLYDEAVPEFVSGRATAVSGPRAEKVIEPSSQTSAPSGSLADVDYTLALYSLRGGHANRAVRFAEQVWKNVPGDYLMELAPQDLVELLYPLPYRDSLLRYTSPRNLDARFLLSIARQESRFQPDAKSGAAARGLMQFIPATAEEIANELGRSASHHDELYNPDTAILFGAQYLANLFKQFPGQPQAVAASYNGGPDNTARWIARSRSNEADRYLPEIGFSQTKEYVYKVMSNYRVYEQLYDSQLQRKAIGNK